MQLVFIGSGFVGTTTAAAMASFGHDVLLYDINEARVASLSSRNRKTIDACLFENGLADLLIEHSDRIKFTTNYADVECTLEIAEAVFICVPTPSREDGSTEMSYYQSALKKLAGALAGRNSGKQKNRVVIINKSTVPVDTAKYTQEQLDKAGAKNVGVVANPEFLVEGRAIEGNLQPTRIVVGATSPKDFAIMRRMYAHFEGNNDIPYIEVNPFEAAAGKLLANYLLFSRLMLCYDVMGRVSEQFNDVTFEAVRKIVCSDPRIGFWGFYDSIYAGGSCLEKDAKSLAHQLEVTKANTDLVRASIGSNRRQIELFLARVKKAMPQGAKGASVAVLGLAFKRDTNDIRNSAGPMVVDCMRRHGAAEVRVYDPGVDMASLEAYAKETSTKRTRVIACRTAADAVRGTSTSVITTDWPEFQKLASVFVKAARAPYLIADGRRMIAADYQALTKKGFTVLAVGSPLYRPTKK